VFRIPKMPQVRHTREVMERSRSTSPVPYQVAPCGHNSTPAGGKGVGYWDGPASPECTLNGLFEPYSAILRLRTPDYQIGMAHSKWKLEEAVQRCIRATQDRPNSPPPFRLLACCYAHMGQLDKARETVERLRSITSLVCRT